MADFDDTKTRRLRRLGNAASRGDIIEAIEDYRNAVQEHLDGFSDRQRELKEFQRRSDEYRETMTGKIDMLFQTQSDFRADFRAMKAILFFIAGFTGTTMSALIVLLIKKWASL